MPSACFDRLAHPGNLVTGEVVGDDDVTWHQARGELLFDIGEEQFAIHGAVEQARRDDAVMTQAGDEGGCHPVPVRHAADRPFAARRTGVAARHIGRHAAFVDKDQPAGIELRLDVAPGLPCRGDIGTALLRGVLGLFLASRPAGAASSRCRAG